MTAAMRPQTTTTTRDMPDTPSARPTWDDLTEAVRDEGQYTTTAEAARVTRVVLAALAGQITGEERAALARSLPEEAERLITSRAPASRPLTAAEFVDATETRVEGATPAKARWDVSAVLSTLPHLVGAPLTDRVLAQLPAGYALLFGIAELPPAS